MTTCRFPPVLAFAVGALVLASTTTASAYLTPTRFEQPAVSDGPLQGGGGGRYFTGSLVDGYRCDVCHTGKRRMPWGIEGLPDPRYDPDTTYRITVYWPQEPVVGETLTVGGAFELVDDEGKAAGSVAVPGDSPAEALCAGEPTATPMMTEGGRQIIALRACPGGEPPTQTDFMWTPPPDGGAVWFHGVLVQGDGNADTEGDAFASTARLLHARGTPPEDVSAASSSCAVAQGRSSRSSGLAWLGLAALAMRGRRRRRCRPYGR